MTPPRGQREPKLSHALLPAAALAAVLFIPDWTSPTEPGSRGTLELVHDFARAGEELQVRFRHPAWGDHPVAIVFGDGGADQRVRLGKLVDGVATVSLRIPEQWGTVQVNAPGAGQVSSAVLPREESAPFALDCELGARR